MEAALEAVRDSTEPIAVSCYHCGDDLPPGPFYGNFGGKDLGFCCPGCLAVCGQIYDAGLEAYYEKRDGKGFLTGTALPLITKRDPEFVKTDGDYKEASLFIEGIRCSACVWLIERAVGRMPGIADSRINFSTHRMYVRWKAGKSSINDILEKIRSVGYRAAPYDSSAEMPFAKAEDGLLIRLAVAGFGFVAAMFFAEGLYGGFFWGMDSGFRDFFQWMSLIISIPVVFYSGFPFLSGALRGIRGGIMTMDLPIALGTLITFFYSAWTTIEKRGDVYFDSAVMFVFLVLMGRYLEAAAKRKAWGRTAALGGSDSKEVSLIKDSLAIATPISSIKIGDVVEIKPGGNIPLDGVVVDGDSSVDESMLTGEARPVRKIIGSTVYGGTLNTDGMIRFEVTKTGPDTLLAGIKRIVEDAQTHKARIQRIADRAAAYFIPAVLVAALLTYLYWSAVDTGHALIYAVTVLIITCPCALALATPAAILVGCGAAAKEGILVKSGLGLEKMHRAAHVVFDKTGTITEGKMAVTDVVPADNENAEEMIYRAAILEKFSEHPVGKAICAYALKNSVRLDRDAVSGFKAFPGKGVEGVIRRGGGADESALVGSRAFMEERGVPIPGSLSVTEERLNGEGKTVVYVGTQADDTKILGLIAVSDPPRAESSRLVKKLKDMGLKVTLLSGDSRRTSEAVAKTVGIDSVIAGVLPSGKEEIIKGMQKRGEVVVMVGDGINDGPALASADVGVAIGSGTDLAIKSADIVLLNSDTFKLVRAIELSKNTFRVIKGNLVLSVLYNLIMVPLAAAGYVVPVVAAAVMPLSSLAVIGNSLRAGR